MIRPNCCIHNWVLLHTLADPSQLNHTTVYTMGFNCCLLLHVVHTQLGVNCSTQHYWVLHWVHWAMGNGHTQLGIDYSGITFDQINLVGTYVHDEKCKDDFCL